MAALGQTDNRVNAIQTAIEDPNAATAINAQFDIWNTSGQAPLTITYQFETAQPADLDGKNGNPWGQYTGWTAFTAAQEAAIRSVLDEYESIINVRFVRNDALADPDLNFGRVNLGTGVNGFGGWGFAYSLDGNNQVTSKTLDQYAVFKNSVDIAAAANRSLLLHEIGHAMTLEHPGPYDAGGGAIPKDPHLPTAEDSNKYTVMSYTANPDNGLNSDHLMLYDIAALQARFGANMSYRTGDDTYTGPNGLIQTIWDAGGTDMIDGSGKQQAVTIDLREGGFSSLGALNNLSIAFGAVIENATGSGFGDTLIGNEIANVLTGGAGNDSIDGGNGNDTVVFSGLRSQYQVTMLSATSARLVDIRNGSPDGTDAISNVELVRFADGMVNFGDLQTLPAAGSVAIGDVIIGEGNAGTKVATFTVTRSGGTAAFDVNYATSNGTATTADGDYAATSNVLHFGANETAKTISVTINGDTKAEVNETFNVLLSGATNGATISDSQGVGTISNDDVAAVAGSVAIGDVIIGEGNAGTKVATFTVTRSGGTAAFDVNYATSNGTATTADGDYAATSNVLHFGANETAKTISVTINGDTKAEVNETFNVLLSGATNGATISDSQGVGTISNDDVAAVAGSVAIGDVIIGEGNAGTKVATFTVTRSGGTAAFDVNYATSNGTATTADGDYAATSNVLHFGANETAKTISVTINGDTKAEVNETFNVLLSGATNGATISDSQGVGTISNDDVAAVAGSVAIGDVIIGEGNAGTKVATFTVTRSGGTAAFDVNYATSNGTATTADGDYAATSNVLHFGANETAKTISVTINGDTKAEVNETFNVLLSGATNGATISDNQGVGTISNDDVAAVAGSVAIGDVIIGEGNAGTKVATFTVTRSGGTAAFDVNYATSNGTATTADGDYAATSNVLHFGANETAKTISVTINGDTKAEVNETFNVLLSGATNGATISDSQGVGTISNDDVAAVAGSVAIGDVIIGEGNAGTKVATFTVTRSGGTAAFDVNYATSNGTATTADGDYAATSNVLHFGANETAKTISVTINGDTKAEVNETFNVLLSGATNGATISDNQGVGTISNDDVAAMPDLLVSGISAPDAVRQGDSLDFSFLVKNLGAAAAGLHYAGINVDAAVDENHYVAWNTVNSLAGNSQGTFTGSIDTADLAIGQHTLYIKEDFWYNGVSESNESNNSIAFTFNVTGNNAPDVTTHDQTVGVNEWSQAFWFIDYMDPDGDVITQFNFWDGGTAANSGYFWTPNNPHHAAGTIINVDAAHLEDVWFRGGQTTGTESLWVQAFDGQDWSQWKPLNVTTDPFLY